MKKIIKNFRLNLFTAIEIIFAFTVITIALSLDLGYLNQLVNQNGSKEMLYILNGFTILAVIVTAIGITGIQLIHVYRRTSEIGLRKAIGANSMDILLLILNDTIKLILIPAIGGVIAGTVLSFVLPFDQIGLEAYINVGLIAAIAVALLLFTLLSGSVPAFCAARMEPVAALGRRHGILSSRPAKTHRRIASRVYTGLFFLTTTIIILSGVYINYSLEAEKREDTINSAGSPPATTLEAPAFSFIDASGQVITSASLEGKSYCLLIWDVGCTPSQSILNTLNELVKDGQLKNSDIYAVSLDKSSDVVEKYIAENKLSIAAYIDNDKSTKWAYKANTLPALYIIGNDGIIKSRSLGWSDTMKKYLVQKIKG